MKYRKQEKISHLFYPEINSIKFWPKTFLMTSPDLTLQYLVGFAKIIRFFFFFLCLFLSSFEGCYVSLPHINKAELSIKYKFSIS